jgi:hypothetical protein
MAYLQRGRFHAHLSDESLIDQWISAAHDMCLDASSAQKQQTESDLKAELDLRGLAAPFDALQTELQILHQRFADGIERLRRDNPEEFARVNAQLAGLVGDFQERKASSQN